MATHQIDVRLESLAMHATAEPTKMTVKLAKQITGGLGHPSKMPGLAYGFAAARCVTGAKLAQVEGSVCHGCYALKANYLYPSVQQAHGNRFGTWHHPRWVEAMVFQIARAGETFFRWHDSGDLQDVYHLQQIARVCAALPAVKFWLPTREYRIVAQYRAAGHAIPANLVIRLSAHMVDAQPPTGFGLPTSSVHSAGQPHVGELCQAYTRKNVCGDCRACWSAEVANVSYKKH